MLRIKAWAFSLVGSIGLEPTTSTMSTWRSDQLSYDPKHEVYYIAPWAESQPFSANFLKKLRGAWITAVSACNPRMFRV